MKKAECRSSAPGFGILALILILDDIIEQALRARPGSGISVAMNGKIQQVYP